jgi:diaminopimelate decarboxylase
VIGGSELRIQDLPISQIAEEFDTPLYIHDSKAIAASYAEVRDALPLSTDIFFSLKANPNVSVCALLRSLGAGAEVSSLTELMTAVRAGVRPEDIIFVGPGKNEAELEACLRTRVYAVVCESLGELVRLNELAERRPEQAECAGVDRQRVMIRINPNFTAHGAGLAMSGKPRQFGIDLETAANLGDVVSRLRNVEIVGVHVYMGTRFLDADAIIRNTEMILSMAADLAEKMAIPLRVVDFGGGLGVAYFDNEKDLDMAALASGLSAVIEPFREAHDDCRLIMETGRYLTATAGTYVVRVLDIKESMGESFVIVDGGTNHHMAAVGIGSFVKRNFPVTTVSTRPRAASGKSRRYTVCGPLCTPEDVIAKHAILPTLFPGDLVAVQRSGAYGATASPGLFLSHGYPAEVMVHGSTAHLVRIRDEAEDLLSKQRLVSFPVK